MGVAPIDGIDDAIDVAAGADFVLAVRRDGVVTCHGACSWTRVERPVSRTLSWGRTVQDGGAETLDSERAIRVFAGARHACLLRADHTIACWGDNRSGQVGGPAEPPIVTTPRSVDGQSDVIDLALGTDHTCALRVDGSVHCWGLDWNGSLGAGQTIADSFPAEPILSTGDVASGCYVRLRSPRESHDPDNYRRLRQLPAGVLLPIVGLPGGGASDRAYEVALPDSRRDVRVDVRLDEFAGACTPEHREPAFRAACLFACARPYADDYSRCLRRCPMRASECMDTPQCGESGYSMCLERCPTPGWMPRYGGDFDFVRRAPVRVVGLP